MLAGLLFATGVAAAPADLFALADFTAPVISGRQLVQGGTTLTLRSFAYAPRQICHQPGVIDDSLTNTLLLQRDGPLIRAVGGNAVRIFGALVVDADGIGTIGTTNAYVQELAAQGLWVIMGTEIAKEMDFSSATLRGSTITAHRSLVAQFKSEPNVLMWLPGNELNGKVSPASDWYSLLELIAQEIKAEQGGGYPFVTAVDGDSNLLGGEAAAPSVDIWGVNLYRGNSLANLFNQVVAGTTKPFWIAEWGIDSWDNNAAMEDQIAQANFLKALWQQVEKENAIIFGGDIAFWSDEWWKSAFSGPATPCVHDHGGSSFGGGPDNFINEEWLGIMALTAGAPVSIIVPKAGYQAVRAMWACPPPPGQAPFLADFNAILTSGVVSNNYAGFIFSVNNFSEPLYFTSAAGASGAADDQAHRTTGTLISGGSLFVLVHTMYPDGYIDTEDISAFDTLAFDVRKGTATTHGSWSVRLDDDVNLFNTKRIALPALTTSFQTLEIDLADFLSGPATPVDLTRTNQIVFVGEDLTGAPYEVDLIVDNIQLFDSANPPSCSIVATSADFLNFGVVDVAAPPQLMSFELQNTGLVDLTITSPGLQIVGDASFSVNSGPSVSTAISGGSSVTVEIAFDPATAGSKAATLENYTDDFELMQLVIPLEGIAVDGQSGVDRWAVY